MCTCAHKLFLYACIHVCIQYVCLYVLYEMYVYMLNTIRIKVHMCVCPCVL